MQLSGFNALVEALKKDRMVGISPLRVNISNQQNHKYPKTFKDFISRPINIFYVDPDTLSLRRYTPGQIENARPVASHYRATGRYPDSHRLPPKRGSDDVRLALGAQSNQPLASIVPIPPHHANSQGPEWARG